MKDRYSKSFVFFILCFFIFVFLLRNDKEKYAIVPILIGLLPFAVLFNKSSNIHLSENQKNFGKIQYKGENDCGFAKKNKKNIDGIRYNGKRYKFVNGTDFYINKNDEVKPCGLGSALMQIIGGGGCEVKSIQNNDCWI